MVVYSAETRRLIFEEYVCSLLTRGQIEDLNCVVCRQSEDLGLSAHRYGHVDDRLLVGCKAESGLDIRGLHLTEIDEVFDQICCHLMPTEVIDQHLVVRGENDQSLV